MKSLKLFWWAPVRSPRMAWWEMKANPGAWFRLGMQTGRYPTNFGDELSKHVVEAVSGRRVSWAPPQSADVVAVGSVLGLYASMGSGATVWGSGIREPLSAVEAGRLVNRLGPVLAVRGKLTRQTLGLPDTQPLGDPGVLAPMFRKPRAGGKRRPLAIPHFRAWASTSGRQLITEIRKNGFEVAEPTLHPLDMIQRISDASLVLTSSLHGLIIGHAMGIPTQLVVWGREGTGEPDFKYADYFSSVHSEVFQSSISVAFDRSKLRQVQDEAEARVALLEKQTSTLAAGLLRAGSDL